MHRAVVDAQRPKAIGHRRDAKPLSTRRAALFCGFDQQQGAVAQPVDLLEQAGVGGPLALRYSI